MSAGWGNKGLQPLWPNIKHEQQDNQIKTFIYN